MSATDWDKRYETDHYVFGTDPSPFLEACAPRLRPGQKGLAVADGEGRNGVWMARQGVDVLALDWSEAGLAKARRLAKTWGVALRTECADMLAWAWPEGAFDVVCAMNFHPDPADQAFLFKAMARSLTPGGWLIFEGIHKSTRDHHDPLTLYDAPLMRALCADLIIETLSERDDGAKRRLQMLARRG
ncbi:class I SAM-dependent methyltransferase [Pararhodospirillum oryzae]|uniref:Methyltransferase domain-containing protein n=1 Tax=Pararhodospirillum oryzae TaxID=478448 RepID=A0A512HC57_9PROT|nr:class I SAM-dependent methyltransferase [Pararhodospirillum oryzae]GEO83032.1 hypothetical protein ROR02_31630 [Pararhodospirillum oryzae]